MTRRSAKQLGLAVALGALLPAVTSCGIQPTGISALGPAPAAAGASPVSSLDTTAGTTQIQLFFYQDGRLSATYRTANKGDVTENVVLTALLAGPTTAEQNQGYTTLLPTGLVARPRANGLAGAYSLNQPLGVEAKAQFICTMQYYDQTISVGIEVLKSATVNWNACSDTTDTFVPMQGDPAIANAFNSGS